VEILQVGVTPLAIQRSGLSAPGNGSPAVGQSVIVAIRPEKIAISGRALEGQSNMIQAHLQAVHFLGDRYEYTVQMGAETRVLVSPASQHLKAGENVFLELKSEGITLWPREA
jgi:ABC-type sugar transport system ATPase subunit